MTRRRQKQRGRRFIQLWTNVKRSQAYFDLDVYARAALIEIMDRFTGINNGMISISARECAEALGCKKSRAGKALRDLDDSGLAQPTAVRKWPSRMAVTWRLTFRRCDASGEPPIMNWPARQCVVADCEVREGALNGSHSASGRTEVPKSSMNGSPHSARGRTHIDVNHRVNGFGNRTASEPSVPGVLSFIG